MDKIIKQNLLLFSVFITGACVLIIEVVAVRALSPYFGNTIFTVSSVISVVLSALSIGYYTGGKFADRHPSLQWFFGIILVSGLAVLALYLVGRVALPFLSAGLTIATGSLFASLILFFLPALLLGTLSPYAIKLQSVQSPEQGVGDVSGKIFFWSTLGSIIGSLLSGFVLIPHFGVDYIFIATGTTLVILGAFSLFVLAFDKKYLQKLVLVSAFFVYIAVFTTYQTERDVLYRKDGVYEKITIYDGKFNGRATRFFQQDRSPSAAMFLDSSDPTDLAYDYTGYYMVHEIFKQNIQNALVIGAGAYSIPKALLAELPHATVDVSEIEPSLYELAKKYFSVKDDSRLINHVKDGRRFLQDSDKKYDMIFSDVYYSLFSIPVHFTTQEFFNIAKQKLTTDGVFIANVVGDLSLSQPSFLMAEMRTFQSVFPNSYFFAVDSLEKNDLQNIIFVGYKSDKRIDLKDKAFLKNQNKIIRELGSKMIDINKFDLTQSPLLTDDFAPVEYLNSQFLRHTLERDRVTKL